jgi:acetyl coenzyme A synthetase (ADP forming)-like protein
MEFENLFKPKSIAVIGASSTPGKIGYSIVNNLVEGGYRGIIYPINLKETSILGIKAYKSVLDIPADGIDLAILAIPANLCIKTIEECGSKSIKFAVVISAGFAEVGNVELENELINTARKYGMRILGPNVVGILGNPSRCNASFAPRLPCPGNIALISQSGVMVVAIDARSWVENIGISYLVSIGNMADIQIDEVIDYLNNDPDVGTIAVYIEGLKDGHAFMDAAKRCVKPVIAVKAGLSRRGAAAVASHTGSLAGNSEIFYAAMKQCGVIKARNLSDLFSRSKALAVQPPLEGDNILVITNGGGAGVLTADASELYGIPLKEAPDGLQQVMQRYMPSFGSARNPVDLTGMATTAIYYDTVKTALLQDWVDGLIVLYSVTATTDPVAIADAVVKGARDSGITNKPLVASFLGGLECQKAITHLIENRVPAYDGIEVAVDAMAALRELSKSNNLKHMSFTPYLDVNKQIVRTELNKIRGRKNGILNELEVKVILSAYGLPVIETFLTNDEDEAVSIANNIGYPVVMKIASPQIIHKSDAGGVKLNVNSEKEVREIFKLLVTNARNYNEKVEIKGITIQRMAQAGTEIIIGSARNSAFGPVVMFGLGGIFVELLKEVVFRVAPISKESAKEMMQEMRFYSMFEGLRGEAPGDVSAIAESISRLSQLVHDFNEIKEVDINPIIVYQQGKGCKVVDARIILES